MVIRLTNGRNIGWTGKSRSWSGTLDHYFANSDIRNNYRLYFTTKDFNSNGAIILSLHFTAATKLATQENSEEACAVIWLLSLHRHLSQPEANLF
jgi:hypothetical protein